MGPFEITTHRRVYGKLAVVRVGTVIATRAKPSAQFLTRHIPSLVEGDVHFLHALLEAFLHIVTRIGCAGRVYRLQNELNG